jgi:tRNA modification GTPase
MAETDTLAAIATAPGRGAVGILRLSGPQALAIAEVLCGRLPLPRQAGLRHFRDAAGDPIDQGLVLVMPGPGSFTGEDVVELQGHGGPVVLDQLLRAACTAGARIARPGEFSERAFLNGRLDLAQAEAIADLVDAGSARAARAALRAMDGVFSARVAAIHAQLVDARVFLEGALDFSDEAIDWLTDAGLAQRLQTLQADLVALLAEAERGRRLQQGLTLVLTGAPNVGKSTLLNRLAGTEAAIVTEIPGTTRDLLRESLLLDGLPVTLIDTAGLRESEDPVEREGIRRAWRALDQADLALFLYDDRQGLTAADEAMLARLPPGLSCWHLANKADLSGGQVGWIEAAVPPTLRLCAARGEGVEALIAALHRHAGLAGAEEPAFTARSRHLDALQQARAAVQAAIDQLAAAAPAELAAEELRLAQQALDEITGRFTSEDLLGRIFAGFCIGK